MNLRITAILFVCSSFLLTLSSCSSGSGYRYVEEGLDKVIKQYREVPNYTILLYDMNYQNNQYVHKYQVLLQGKDTSFNETLTDWLEVSPTFFQKNEGNLGMELASKKDGKLTKEVAPAGYSQYVGSERYGQWVQRDGGSFWEFYGKYALLSSVFNMFSRPAYYSSWNTYDRDYRGRSTPYYGTGGYYGTGSYVNTSSGKNTTWGKQPSSFKQKVRSQVNQSVSSSKRSSRTSRSSSRYSRSSSRSRSGGRGGK